MLSLTRIEPIMYERIILPTDAQRREKLLRSVSMAPDKFATHVKYLCFPFKSSPFDAVTIMKVCKRVLYFAWWIDSSLSRLNECVTSQQPRRVSFRVQFDTQLDLSHPFFIDITHLELIVSMPEMPLMDLHKLPRLTHLRIIVPQENIYINDFVRGCLARCRGIQACLLRYKTAPIVLRSCDEIRDNRVVMVPYKDPASEWEAAVNGLPDMWTAADTFIQQRRQGGTV
jgi:hypothetical protein